MSKMKIEVLYFDGCPNHKPAIKRVQEVLNEEGIFAQISEVHVRDHAFAQQIGFLGSPSIRVNGLDVEPATRPAHEYGMMCRTYIVDGRREGCPSREMIRQAIREASSGAPPAEDCCQPAGNARGLKEASNSSSLLAASSVVGAILASFCCILPIVFALAGVSIAGASALFAAWRPYLLALTFGLLALGFYLAYRPRKEDCAPGSACAIPATRRTARLMLWTAAGAVALFAAFPYYSGPVAEFLLLQTSITAASQPARPVVEHATFGVEGMDCSACARTLESRLRELPGVRNAAVSFAEKRADVDYDPNVATLSQMEKIVEDAGYRIRKG